MRRPATAAERAASLRNPGSGQSQLGLSVAEFVATKPKRKRGSARGAFKRALAEWSTMRETGQIRGMKGRHFVALFHECHEGVYGVAPAELLDGETWFGAASAAERMLVQEFAGNVESMIEFVRWVWRRERTMEKRRRSDGIDGRRIGWRLMYLQRVLLTDYRVALRRNG
jgi:hypothetical protein